jgi:hypothetical protein
MMMIIIIIIAIRFHSFYRKLYLKVWGSHSGSYGVFQLPVIT